MIEHHQADGSKGALIGGLLGFLSGEGQSGSNKALRTIGGMAIGSAIDKSGERQYVHRYSIDVGRGSLSYIIMPRRDFRLGDCVAIEKGRSANLRHVASVFCEQEVPEEYRRSHVVNADACEKAKQQVLEANTEETIHQAALKMKVLCDD